MTVREKRQERIRTISVLLAELRDVREGIDERYETLLSEQDRGVLLAELMDVREGIDERYETLLSEQDRLTAQEYEATAKLRQPPGREDA